MIHLVHAGGTITLTGRTADFCQEIAALRAKLDPIQFGSLEFHFAGPKVSVKVVESRFIRRDD